MKKESGTRHIIDMVFVVALLFLFSMSALMLIAIGSSIYSRGVDVMKKNYDSRTAYAYITEKLRQYDSTGNVSVEFLGSSKALRVDSTLDGTAYVTYLYEHGGELMELFARADSGKLHPSSGQKIMEIDTLEIEPCGDGLMEITVTLKDGTDITFVTSRRSVEVSGT
ncbi:MAG: DUF4860 domain-containing protein [Butyrivibrio sp.]|nr:DUF4860 domain-containing protein [Butyrivibrio sp.]